MNKSAHNTVIDCLFESNSSAMSDWVEKVQARAVASAQSTRPAIFSVASIAHTENDLALMSALCESVEHDGYALYQWSDSPDDIAETTSEFLRQLSLVNTDKGVIRESGELSLLQDLSGTPKGRFPPYQSKAMNWHSDGYYNAATDTVRCFTLHCVEPAAEGGALVLMDDTLLVLALLEDNPDNLALLCHPDAMTLPANRDELGHDRPDRCVPMVQRNADESVSVRYTTRTQNIAWRCADTEKAALRATELIQQNSQWHTKIKLAKGQGIIPRNVLHAREPFNDPPGQNKRQMLRGRFNQLPSVAH